MLLCREYIVSLMRRLPLLLAMMVVLAPRGLTGGAATPPAHAPARAASASVAGGSGGTSSSHKQSPHGSAAHNARKRPGKGAAHKKAEPASGVAGVVRDHKRPLAGAALTCTQGRHTWRARTDHHGAFRLALAPGRYRCDVTAHGYKAATVTVAVRAHTLTHVTFTLSEAKKAQPHRAKPTPTAPMFSPPTQVPAPPSGPLGSETCRWTNTHALYADTNASYWATNLSADPNLILTIQGSYPAARYASIQVYNAQGEYITGLSDRNMPPDPGTVNPFATQRHRDTGRYTLHLVFGRAPAHPAAGSLYAKATPGDTVILAYRIYLPDLGADQKGNVPLPSVTTMSLVTGAPLGCPVAAYTVPPPVATTAPITATPTVTGTAPITTGATPTPTPTRTATLTPIPGAPTPTSTPQPPPTTAGFTRLSGEQLGGYDNVDAAYLVSPLPPRLGLYVVRFKPPTTPHTLSGGPIDLTTQVRYWSICVYSVIGPYTCTADEQAQLDKNGQVTLVLGPAWARPPNLSSASGVTWVDLGSYFLLPYKVILRELLPSPRFTSSISAVPLGAAPDAYMGAYAPTLSHCSITQFQANYCA